MAKEEKPIAVIPAPPGIPVNAPEGVQVLEYKLPEGVEVDHYQVFPENAKCILSVPKGYKLNLASRIQVDKSRGQDGTYLCGGTTLLHEKFQHPPVTLTPEPKAFRIVVDPNDGAVAKGQAITVRQAWAVLAQVQRILKAKPGYKLAQPLLEPIMAEWIKA